MRKQRPHTFVTLISRCECVRARASPNALERNCGMYCQRSVVVNRLYTDVFALIHTYWIVKNARMEEKEEMIDIRITGLSKTDKASIVAWSVVIISFFINFSAFILNVPLHLQIFHNHFIIHHSMVIKLNLRASSGLRPVKSLSNVDKKQFTIILADISSDISNAKDSNQSFCCESERAR